MIEDITAARRMRIGFFYAHFWRNRENRKRKFGNLEFSTENSLVGQNGDIMFRKHLCGHLQL